MSTANANQSKKVTNENFIKDLQDLIYEEVTKEMSSVGGVAGFNAPIGDDRKSYHGDHVDRKKGVYKSDTEDGEKKRPRKKGHLMMGRGPQGDKYFSKYESVSLKTKKELNEFISGIVAADLLNTDLTPECMDGVTKLQKTLSDLQVDINSSFAHAQEFLKLGIKTHREIEFKRLAVEAKRLSNLVTKYRNIADQLANMAGDVNHRSGTQDLVMQMQQQVASPDQEVGEQ